MTGLLEEALRRLESLSKEADEKAWARSFREKPEVLRSLAREAL
jgi:hypothetical protein